MPYERYRRGRRSYTTPAISVTSRRLRLNSAATQIVVAAKISRMIILFDPANCKMALQQAPAGDEDSYAINVSKGQGATLAAKSFFRGIGWSATKGVTLPASWNVSERMLEFKLPAELVGGGKNKPARVRGKSKPESGG